MKRNQYVVIENLRQTASDFFRMIVHCKVRHICFDFTFIYNINKLQNKNISDNASHEIKHGDIYFYQKATHNVYICFKHINLFSLIKR